MFRSVIYFILVVFSFSILFVSCSKEDEATEPNVSQNDGNNDGGGTLITGCMDEAACNFNPQATEADNSCDYSCYGCTDEIALNYDSNSEIDDGSCVYPIDVILNTWNVSSDCDGLILGFVAPDEMSVQAGDNQGDLIFDLGFITLNGTLSSAGLIVIPGQDPIGLGTTVSGSGVVLDENNVSVFLTVTTILGSENCTLTLTL